MKSKRFSAALRALAAMILLSCLLPLSGCAPETATLPIHVEGSIFGGRSDDRIPLTAEFSPDWLTKGNNTKYSKQLAAFSALLCADVYFRDKDLPKGTQNRVLVDGTEYDRTVFLKSLGFTDVRYVETFREKEYAEDGNDSATLTLGYCSADGKYDVFVAAVRGCFSAQEWISVFDPGCEGNAYEQLTGNHPEWMDRDQPKGLNIAANRAMEFLQEFIETHNDPDAKNCILVTGHSRGGAIANILGGKLERESDARTFTYTFSAPPVTLDPAAGTCRTVFNLFDANDFYTDPLPFGQERFLRFGTDLSLDGRNDSRFREALKLLKDREDYAAADPSVSENYRTVFGGLYPTRESLYRTERLTRSFDSREEAEAARKSLDDLIGSDGFGVDCFCKTTDICEKEGKFSFDLEYCGGAVLVGFSKILAYGETARSGFMTLFAGREAIISLGTLLAENGAAFSCGHLLANGYVMCEFAGAKN